MLTVASIFRDGMVLQQKQQNRIWGTAEPGTGVVLSFLEQTYQIQATADGTWEIRLAQAEAGGPYRMRIKADEQIITIQDILIGEVWFAGGQSNMEMELGDSENGKEVASKADYEQIRFYNVPKYAVTDETLLTLEKKTAWKPAVGSPTEKMSAVAFYFAVKLYETLHVPVGIIDCYWGGTSATCWVTEEQLREVSEVQPYIKECMDEIHSKTDQQYEQELAAYEQEYGAWEQKVEALRKANPSITWEHINEQAGECPWPQPLGKKSPFRPFGLHDVMIKKVAPYGIKGFLYYQGEEDWSRSVYYRKLNDAVIRQWRADFDALDGRTLPFYLTQLPMYIAKNEQDDKNWCVLRRQQELTMQENDNTGMAVLIDCGEFDNIHPTDKCTPGTRLALQVLGKTYQVVTQYDNMTIKQAEFKDREVILSFHNTYGAIHARTTDADTLTAQRLDCEVPVAELLPQEVFGFEVSGDGSTFYQAEVTADKEQLIVHSDEVAKPSVVRYAWTDYGVANVYNAAGLPLAPFYLVGEDSHFYKW